MGHTRKKIAGFLPLTHGHTMYYEEHGNPKGKPVVMLHGGPGGGLHRRFLTLFDLKTTRLILFDQRGCGKSTPFGVASLAHNTTWDLVADMERLRKHLGIDKWFVTGGSWGSTLALVYAETHPDRVTGLLLRSACIMTDSEYGWLYDKSGSAHVFPERYAEFTKPVGSQKGWRPIMKTYRKLLTSRNPATRRKAAKAWWGWESDVSFLRPRPDDTKAAAIESLALLENHYFSHNAWLKPNQILRNAHKLRHIPLTIVHGRYDLICPFQSAWELQQVVPHAKVFAVPDAGHGGWEKGTLKEVKQRMKEML